MRGEDEFAYDATGAMVYSNVDGVMPNLSPQNVRNKYSLYNNKAHSGSEAAESLAVLKDFVHTAGYNVVVDRGDAL